jgi:hypothetical protein
MADRTLDRERIACGDEGAGGQQQKRGDDRRCVTATRFSFERGDEGNPVWTPDSSRVIYTALRRLMIRKADGAGESEELIRSSPDGATLPASCSSPGDTSQEL